MKEEIAMFCWAPMPLGRDRHAGRMRRLRMLLTTGVTASELGVADRSASSPKMVF